MTAEVRQLVTALYGIRAGVLKKLSGLDEADARRTTVGSGTTLAGLVEHLTFVESLWFEEIVGGGVATRGRRSMDVDASVSLRTLRAEYRAACEASNAIIVGIGDADAPVVRNGERRTLRWAVLCVIEETAPPCRPRRHHPRADRRSHRAMTLPDGGTGVARHLLPGG